MKQLRINSLRNVDGIKAWLMIITIIINDMFWRNGNEGAGQRVGVFVKERGREYKK